MFLANYIYCALMLLCHVGFRCMYQQLLTSNAQMLRCRGVLINVEFWGGEQNFVPDMWQVVFAHISVESRVVHSDVDDLLDGSGDAMTISSNNCKVFH